VGRDKWEMQKSGERKNASSRKATNNLYCFRPEDVDLMRLKSGFIGTEDGVIIVEAFLKQGHKLSIGQNLDNGSFYCIIREQGDDWRAARAVGVWTASVEKAIALMGYYLREVNPDFPEGVASAKDFITEW